MRLAGGALELVARSAVVRIVGLVLLFVVSAVQAQSCPTGQTQVTVWVGYGSATFPDAGGACSSFVVGSGVNSSGGLTNTQTETAGPVSGSGSGQTSLCVTTSVVSGSETACAHPGGPVICGTFTGTGATVGVTQSCIGASACASQAGTPAFIGGGSSPGIVCDNGCEVNASNPTMSVHGSGSASPGVIYDSVYTGNTCTGASAAAQCVSGGGQTACAETSKNCGTFNGDEVCPQSLPPGTCESFASGGVACTMSGGAAVTPPAPDNGTAGTPATPSGSVSVTGGNTSDYYNSSTVGASSGGVVGTPGTNVGGGTAGGGAGAPSAANGDCGAPGVDCSGSLPAADASDGTFASVSTSFWDEIQTTPLVTSVAALETAWPSGSCFAGLTLTLATIPGHTYDYGSTFCSIWAGYVDAPLSTISIVVWALIGVFILMSA